MSFFETQESKAHLISLLEDGIVKVTFEKVDGSIREMSCSLRKEHVVTYEKKTDKTKPKNDDILPVFDIDKQQWRSFKWDNIKSFEAVI